MIRSFEGNHILNINSSSCWNYASLSLINKTCICQPLPALSVVSLFVLFIIGRILQPSRCSLFCFVWVEYNHYFFYLFIFFPGLFCGKSSFYFFVYRHLQVQPHPIFFLFFSYFVCWVCWEVAKLLLLLIIILRWKWLWVFFRWN